MGQKSRAFNKVFTARKNARDAFLEVAYNKTSTKQEILHAYKKYRRADDELVNVFETQEGQKNETLRIA